jgi:hypothetical protein
MTERLKLALKDLRHLKGDPVFCNDKAERRTRGEMDWRLKKVCRKAGSGGTRYATRSARTWRCVALRRASSRSWPATPAWARRGTRGTQQESAEVDVSLIAEVHGNRTRRTTRERRPIGFEDRGRHQIDMHFRWSCYSVPSGGASFIGVRAGAG